MALWKEKASARGKLYWVLLKTQCSGMDTANSGEDRWRPLAMRFAFRCQRRTLISIGRWVLWTECFHPPQIHILKPNPQYGRIWR